MHGLQEGAHTQSIRGKEGGAGAMQEEHQRRNKKIFEDICYVSLDRGHATKVCFRSRGMKHLT